MQERGHYCYAALEEGVASQHFDGVSNFLVMPDYVEVASEALQKLRTYPCYATLMPEVKEPKHNGDPKLRRQDAKPVNEKLHNAATKEDKRRCDKSQTAAEKDSKLTGECAQPRPSCHGAKEDKPGGTEMWDVAMDKAKAELEADFNYSALCKQGKELFHMVLADKTKRLFSKMKHRARWKHRKQATEA